jgi:glycine cleavage system aminomethyltransferase T
MADQTAAAGATFEVRDGWEVATSFGAPDAEGAACAESVGFADLSHIAKLELQGAVPDAPLGIAQRTEDGWHCPITPARAFVLGATAPPEGLHALDVTATFGAMVIAGPLARETFARFCAIDLRPKVTPVHAFRPGSVARTPGYVLREAPERYLVLFGAAYGAYFWETVDDAARHLGGRPVGVDALPEIAAAAEEEAAHA